MISLRASNNAYVIASKTYYVAICTAKSATFSDVVIADVTSQDIYNASLGDIEYLFNLTDKYVETILSYVRYA